MTPSPILSSGGQLRPWDCLHCHQALGFRPDTHVAYPQFAIFGAERGALEVSDLCPIVCASCAVNFGRFLGFDFAAVAAVNSDDKLGHGRLKTPETPDISLSLQPSKPRLMEERDVETDSVADLHVAISEEEGGKPHVDLEDDVVGAGIAGSVETSVAGAIWNVTSRPVRVE